MLLLMILLERGQEMRRSERGDVPGWVMICLMSAGFVAALAALAGPRLVSMLDAALTSVGG
jgi:hypothetical protein